MKRLYSLLFFIIFLSSGQSFSQEYVRTMFDDSLNFYQAQKQFNDYWENRTYTKGHGFKQFKRWEEFLEPRVFPSGNLPDPMIAWNETQKFRRLYGQTQTAPRNASNWIQYMTQDTLAFTPFSSIPGHGRVSCMEVDPTDSSRLYIGTPSGGLWFSKNGGDSWTPLTDHLPVIGVADIAINPQNPQEIYIATGDNHFINTYSIGVLKSLNGGQTWNTTDLNYQVNQITNIRRLLIHPIHPDTLWAATTTGLMRTDDGGGNWYSVMSGAMRDIEFKAGNYDTLFATTNGGFYRSMDGGMTFANSGLPENSAVIRMEISSSPANPEVVYVIAVDANTSGLYEFYRSNDGGTTFSTTANTTNILGYFANGGAGGQAWFDLDIMVDPNDENTIYTAGINIWKSINGGNSFSPTSSWSNPYASSYVHGDVHNLQFVGNRLYTTCDGGIFYSDDRGNNWVDISSNLTISQIYAFRQSPFIDNHLLAGMQDVGSAFYDGSQWTTVTWGDGFECFFDPDNPQNMYTSAHQGQFFRTTTGIYGFQQYFPNINETSAFRSVLRQDHHNPKVFYAGFQNVWKSTDATQSWTKISNFGNSFPLQRLEVSPADTNTIYATSNFLAYRTTGGGGAWSNITPGLPTNFAAMSCLYTDPNDAMKVWIGFSGYVNGQKVYYSENGGSTWTNISQNLPNLPINCVTLEGSQENGIYVGTDVGVYYKNDSLPNWIQFMDGLPNVIVNDLDILPTLGIIRAATFGRGVWESNLYIDALPLNNEPSIDKNPSFALYPNPVNDMLMIDFKNYEPGSVDNIEIISLEGKVVRSHSPNKGDLEMTIDVANLSPGIYLCVLGGEWGTKSRRFWVN